MKDPRINSIVAGIFGAVLVGYLALSGPLLASTRTPPWKGVPTVEEVNSHLAYGKFVYAVYGPLISAAVSLGLIDSLRAYVEKCQEFEM